MDTGGAGQRSVRGMFAGEKKEKAQTAMATARLGGKEKDLT